MRPDVAAMLKRGFWTLLLGAVIAIVIGFAWGGWTTAGTSRQRTADAVLATRAAICVAQFMNQSNHQEQLKAFKATNSWERAEFIAKGGWDRMPGETEAHFAVSRACADGIDALRE
jgi:hypothetical protein